MTLRKETYMVHVHMCYLVVSKGKCLESSCTIVKIIFPCPYELIIKSKINDLSAKIIVGRMSKHLWFHNSNPRICFGLLLSFQEILPPASQCLVVMNPNVLHVFNAVVSSALDRSKEEKAQQISLEGLNLTSDNINFFTIT